MVVGRGFREGVRVAVVCVGAFSGGGRGEEVAEEGAEEGEVAGCYAGAEFNVFAQVSICFHGWRRMLGGSWANNLVGLQVHNPGATWVTVEQDEPQVLKLGDRLEKAYKLYL